MWPTNSKAVGTKVEPCPSTSLPCRLPNPRAQAPQVRGTTRHQETLTRRPNRVAITISEQKTRYTRETEKGERGRVKSQHMSEREREIKWKRENPGERVRGIDHGTER